MSLWESMSLSTEARAFALLLALSGGVASALALLAARTLRRRSAPLRYGVLFGGIVGLLASPVLVGVGFSLQNAFTSVREETVRIPVEHLADFLAVPEPTPPPALSEDALPWADWLGMFVVGVWVFGAAVGLVRLVRGLWQQRGIVTNADWHADWWTEERREALALKVGLRAFPHVCRSPVAPMPMVVGVWRPRIVVPDAAPASWAQAQWEAILLHEAAHIARRDPWAILAQHVAVLAYWWCPLVHLLARRLNDLRETICDDYALEGPCDRIAYAQLLVETAERVVDLRTCPAPLGLLDSARGGLEERVTRLLEKEKRSMTKLSLAGKLLGACVLAAACMSITAATAFSQAPPPQKKIQIKIVIDGKEIDLSDADLQELLARAIKKAAAQAAPEKVHVHDWITKEVALGPDTAILAKTDGKVMTVFDAKSGKVIAKFDMGDQAPHDILMKLKLHDPNAHQVQVQAAVKLDPRIEELVKQAEAIKPGSGATIRAALGATPAYGPVILPKPPVPVAPPHAIAQPPAGDKVIVIVLSDGKLLHLHGGAGTKVELPMQKQPGDPKMLELQKAIDSLIKSGQMRETKKAPEPGPPLTTVKPDLEALARKIERLNAELNELRRRLDAEKKAIK
jgi:beta-lactamase regulating signal transducer with metallopeptidase domain